MGSGTGQALMRAEGWEKGEEERWRREEREGGRGGRKRGRERKGREGSCSFGDAAPYLSKWNEKSVLMLLLFAVVLLMY